MSVAEQLGAAREVALPAGTIRYRVRGDGEPLVFVHGVCVNGDLWRGVVDACADRFTCITPDWPTGAHEVPLQEGADLSPPGLADIVADFLEALDLQRVTLVGNDTGGAVCQVLVTRRPGRVARLVLTSCDAFEVFPPTPFQFLGWMARTPGALLLASILTRSRTMLRTPLMYGLVANRLPERAITDSWTRPGRRRLIRRDAAKVFRSVHARHTMAAAERLHEFDRPVLVAWGGDDRLFPLDLGERLAALFPDSRLEVVDGARTFVPEDRPDELAGLITEFVEAT